MKWLLVSDMHNVGFSNVNSAIPNLFKRYDMQLDKREATITNIHKVAMTKMLYYVTLEQADKLISKMNGNAGHHTQASLRKVAKMREMIFTNGKS